MIRATKLALLPAVILATGCGGSSSQTFTYGEGTLKVPVVSSADSPKSQVVQIMAAVFDQMDYAAAYEDCAARELAKVQDSAFNSLASVPAEQRPLRAVAMAQQYTSGCFFGGQNLLPQDASPNTVEVMRAVLEESLKITYERRPGRGACLARQIHKLQYADVIDFVNSAPRGQRRIFNRMQAECVPAPPS